MLEPIQKKRMCSLVGVERFVYARHGRELMGLKSPVSVPCNVVKRNKITSRRQGRYREVGAEESLIFNDVFLYSHQLLELFYALGPAQK